jgi:uncharacterized protein (DUF1501 family)
MLLGQRTSLAQALVQEEQEHDQILVVVFLRGGADGLSLIPPYADDDYHRARPSLGLTKKDVYDLDGQFGLNPALSALQPAWDDGDLAVVHAVGSGDITHSHFEAMSLMERGQHAEGSGANGGWLARHLLSTPERRSPMRAVGISSRTQESLSGALDALGFPSLEDYRLRGGKSAHQRLAKLYEVGSDLIAGAGRETLKLVETLQDVSVADYKPENGAVYGDKHMDKALKETAILIRKDLGLEIVCLDMDGWDTHHAQGTKVGWMPLLMQELAPALAAFRKDLGPIMDRVTVVVQTEFGRRVKETSSLGTDHGSASAMLLMGGGVNGQKVYTDWPGCAEADRTGPGDLKVTTDYRTVLAEILEKRLQTPDTNLVFQGLSSRRLNLLA